MFGFKAYFWNDRVTIGGETYRSNEILTACLNVKMDKLSGYLNELTAARKKLLLREDPGVDFCDEYNGHVQRAQSLFFKIEEIAEELPPYRKLSVNPSDAPLLFDCLNRFPRFWEDGIEYADYDEYGDAVDDEDFVNEYGFSTQDGEGYHYFYHQKFEPCLSALEDQDPEILLELREANESIGALFDSYITVMRDLIHARAYGELLDGYIHREDRFLKAEETAACFTRYLKSTEKKDVPERVAFSGSMQMNYEVARLDDGKEYLCETYSFDSLGAFLYVDFFRGLGRSYLPKRCKNCGQYFLLAAGKYSNYCDRPLKDDPAKTCKDVGARRKYDDKCRNDPIWRAYNRAYKAHYARYLKKKMTTAEFEQWSRYAVRLREQAEAGTLAQAEYETTLKI